MTDDEPVLQQLYRRMLLLRRFDERAIELRMQGMIFGPVHPYIGQEAVAVGICSQLAATDRITSTHRGHGHCLAKGADPGRMFAELFGRRDGYSGGKAGSMHIADFGVGMLGANGVVGAGLPIAAGAALASRLGAGDAVAASFFGDGAVGSGSFHEALNLSSLWRLPVLWVCENNGWAAGTPGSAQFAADHVTDFCRAYSIESERVDGNDVLAVAAAAGRAVARARAGEGPTLIEAVTFRMERHAVREGAIDPRPEAAIAPWRDRDPIAKVRADLLARSVLSETEDADLVASVEQQLDEAVRFAAASPLPEPESALAGFFAAESASA
ncbi:MAG TPA: thiamine pyrophosphate-dependent dehydrogenase E1 component subunit alpha [Pseudonocardiaceae bacterium]